MARLVDPEMLSSDGVMPRSAPLQVTVPDKAALSVSSVHGVGPEAQG